MTFFQAITSSPLVIAALCLLLVLAAALAVGAVLLIGGGLWAKIRYLEDQARRRGADPETRPAPRPRWRFGSHRRTRGFGSRSPFRRR